jgi:hypothetical protein
MPVWMRVFDYLALNRTGCEKWHSFAEAAEPATTG